MNMPLYNPSRHPMETWQEWYLANQSTIDRETEQSNAADIYDPQSHEECMSLVLSTVLSANKFSQY